MSAILALAVGLAACAVGPSYRPPQPVTPDEWNSLRHGEANTAPAEVMSLADWWRTFQDPTLDELVGRALAQSKTAQQAYARVREARARRGIAAGAFWPAVEGSAGVSRTDARSQFEDAGGELSSPRSDEVYTTGLDSAWELDLFGGTRRAFEASNAQLAATEADLRDVLVTLLGEVALGYTDVRTAQARLTFAERNLEAQRGVLDITRWREAAGLASVLDVEQASTSYQQTRAQIPALQSALEQSLNRLAVLTGDPPGSLTALLGPRKPAPSARVEIATGVPADVLRRRPDIRAAERRLAAQTAQVGVATAALYPSLSLTGSITLQALSAGDMLDGARSERLGLALHLPIFRGGALRQNINAQNALVDQALAAYEATVLAAYEEVENSLTAWTNEQRRQEALTQAVASARRAAELALLQYTSGLVDFQTVLSADRQLITLEDALAVSEGEMAANLIRLYKALGGGWSVFPKD